MHAPSLAHINNHLPEQAQPNPTYDMKHRQTFLQLGKEENRLREQQSKCGWLFTFQLT
jgi:hypothetical protein